MCAWMSRETLLAVNCAERLNEFHYMDILNTRKLEQKKKKKRNRFIYFSKKRFYVDYNSIVMNRVAGVWLCVAVSANIILLWHGYSIYLFCIVYFLFPSIFHFYCYYSFYLSCGVPCHWYEKNRVNATTICCCFCHVHCLILSMCVRYSVKFIRSNPRFSYLQYVFVGHCHSRVVLSSVACASSFVLPYWGTLSPWIYCETITVFFFFSASSLLLLLFLFMIHVDECVHNCVRAEWVWWAKPLHTIDKTWMAHSIRCHGMECHIIALAMI